MQSVVSNSYDDNHYTTGTSYNGWYAINTNQPTRTRTIFDDVKLLVGPLSKVTAQVALKRLSYSADIWKLKFNIEKCLVLHIGLKDIKVNYK